MDWEIVIGLEIHAQLATQLEDLLRRVDDVRRAAEQPSEPRRSRLPRRAAGAERRSRHDGREVRPRDALRDRAAFRVRAQELLLSGSAEGLSDQPVRAADRARRQLDVVLEDGSTRTVGIVRAHLEEDAGKSLHEDFAGMSGIDLNRAGTGLLEIVSAPDLRSAAEAGAYMRKIHALVRYLEICDGNMQEGSFRCDANVSVRRARRNEARHAHRAQEPELVPVRREGDRDRSRAADRAASKAAARSRRRRGCSIPIAKRRGRCAARKKRTTIATSRIPISCRSRSTQTLDRRRARIVAGAARREARALHARLCPARLRRRRC